MDNAIPITQYALSGFISDMPEAKEFLDKYDKNSYNCINRLCIKQEEKDYTDKLFKQVNDGEITFKEANRLLKINNHGRMDQNNLFTSEKEFEEAISAYLNECGINHKRQVNCFSGISDIISDSYLIELKLSYSDNELRHAIGQVIAYGLDECNRDKHKIIVFPSIPCANKQVFGNKVYAPLLKLDLSEYLEAKYGIYVCDIDRFKFIMSLGEHIEMCTGGGYR